MRFGMLRSVYRLRALLEWALANRCFMVARGRSLVFGLRGRSGARVFTFMGNGALYWFVADRYYPSTEERDELFGVLRGLRTMSSPVETWGGIWKI